MKWALVGELKEPYKITEEQLLGNVVITPHEPLPLERHPGYRMVGEKVTWLDDFQISLLDFKLNIIQQKIFLHSGFNVMGVVAYHRGKVIGISHDKYTVIDKDYRGGGLGFKLLAEQFLSVPGNLEYRRNDTSKRHYTLLGLKTIKAAYRYMHCHGAVVGE